MRNECNIIQDILPLYIEDMVSSDTASLVEEHISDCAVCRAILEDMKTPRKLECMQESNSLTSSADALPLKVLKRKLRNRKIVTIITSFVLASAFVFGSIYLLMFHGIKANSTEIKLTTEFQYNDEAYLNQVFTLHAERLDGQPIITKLEEVHKTNEHGEEILTGYEITFRKCLISNGNPSRYAIGYAYPADSTPDEDFDFTISVHFDDKIVVYSMIEEGLFTPQENTVIPAWKK